MPKPRVKLHGFNNLTKTLSFNIYDICYANSPSQVKEYIHSINRVYNAVRLTQILKDVAQIIGANILNIAHQDYEPAGTSVSMLTAEETVVAEDLSNTQTPGPLPGSEVLPDALAAHLDKSHLTIHTYPESHPENGISTFRADIDISTCGRVSPLKALNYLIHSFDSDIVTMDYRVRGFTRDVHGHKHYIDHPINSIQNFLARDTHERYEMVDVNVSRENIFHTKMRLKDFNLDNYLFGVAVDGLSAIEQKHISQQLQHEMLEIFYARNMPKRH